MSTHSKKISMQSKDNAFAIIAEIIASKKPFNTPVERHNIFEYVQGMTKELSKLSSDANNSFLSYLLTLAAEEAQLAKKTAGREICTL